MVNQYVSVFEQRFDVVVYGSGYAAVAAAWKLAEQGRDVLLCSRRFDLVWESGRAFAAQAGDLNEPIWQQWLAELGERGLYRDGLLDAVAAEVSVCRRLRNAPANLRVLLGVSLIGGTLENGRLRSVRVATKAGERVLHAAAWIDATEHATLFTLGTGALAGGGAADGAGGSGVAVVPAIPTGYEQRAVLRGVGLDELDFAAASAALRTQGNVRLERRVWKKELSLCITSDKPLGLADLSERAQAARAVLDGAAAQAAIVQLGSAALAVFDGSGQPSAKNLSSRPVNLYSASAALAGSEVRTLAQRFALGIAGADALLATGGCAVEEAGVSSLAADCGCASRGVALKRSGGVELPKREIECDVFVAGAGSAGAVAALAAAREGANVLVVDTAASAGGVATGGLIVGYFHGQPGGLFEALDIRADEVKAGLDPSNTAFGGRHHEAKKIAFERTFAQSEGSAFLSEALAYGARVEQGRVVEVLVATEHCVYVVRPRAVIDATGDGDLAALAGASFDHGRPGDGLSLSYSQPCLRVAENRDGVIVRSSNFDAGWVDATDPEDMTRARLVGIAQYWDGQWEENEHVLQLAPVMGLRQSRHIRTEAVLTLDDMIRHRTFEDSIGSVRSPMDTHSVDFEFEDDEMLFWQWGCKNFRGMTHAQMPYRALVPKGLRNVWIACRASGISVSAAYAVRMLRDVQRMGEAAGIAAAVAVRLGCDALNVPREQWQPQLERSGALRPCEAKDDWQDDPLTQLDKGESGGYLWTLFSDPGHYRVAVTARLNDANAHVSWLAALVVAMWGDVAAQPRLLQAIAQREEGLPTPRSALGAHGQWIDVPNWVVAVCLLRRCGTAVCLPELLRLAQERSNLLNLRTTIGVTVARLARRIGVNHLSETEDSVGGSDLGGVREMVAAILAELASQPLPETLLRPSRSLYRSLLGQEQLWLPQEPQGVDTREDHLWQLWLVIDRAEREWGIASTVNTAPLLADERALVRKAFA